MIQRIPAWQLAVYALLLAACGSREHLSPKSASHATPQTNAPQPDKQPEPKYQPVAQEAITQVAVHHVIFHENSGLHLKTEWMRGRLFPSRPGVIPSLDDPNSFKVEVIAGVTRISISDLSRALFAGISRQSKLSNLRMSPHGAKRIEIKGLLHRGIPVPIHITGDIEATPDGRFGIVVRSVRVFQIPVKSLMRAVHLSAPALTAVKDSHAVEIDGDTILLRTEELLPPPAKLGRLTDVHFTPSGDLEEDYGSLADRNEMSHKGKQQNFMSIKGGQVRLGKLVMSDADLTLIDSSPGDWFEFDLARYRRQLAGGDMHMTPSGGLLIFTPDITKVRASGARAAHSW
jgi:hypothetical protein